MNKLTSSLYQLILVCTSPRLSYLGNRVAGTRLSNSGSFITDSTPNPYPSKNSDSSSEVKALASPRSSSSVLRFRDQNGKSRQALEFTTFPLNLISELIVELYGPARVVLMIAALTYLVGFTQHVLSNNPSLLSSSSQLMPAKIVEVLSNYQTLVLLDFVSLYWWSTFLSKFTMIYGTFVCEWVLAKQKRASAKPVKLDNPTETTILAQPAQPIKPFSLMSTRKEKKTQKKEKESKNDSFASLVTSTCLILLSLVWLSLSFSFFEYMLFHGTSILGVVREGEYVGYVAWLIVAMESASLSRIVYRHVKSQGEVKGQVGNRNEGKEDLVDPTSRQVTLVEEEEEEEEYGIESEESEHEDTFYQEGSENDKIGL